MSNFILRDLQGEILEQGTDMFLVCHSIMEGTDIVQAHTRPYCTDSCTIVDSDYGKTEYLLDEVH